MYISYSFFLHAMPSYHIEKISKFNGDDIRAHVNYLKEHLLTQAYDLDKLVADGWVCELVRDCVICYNHEIENVDDGILRLKKLGITADPKRFDTHGLGFSV